MTKGYIYVASVSKLYYEYALNSAQTLRDVYPEADITLFTHDVFVDDRAEQLFNNIITNIPVSRRAKMWCLARTPYDQTFYNDADSLVVHPDISKVFDDLDHHIYMCENAPHTVSRRVLQYIDLQRTKPVIFHGAVAWFKKNDLNIEFMDTWYNDYIEQLYNPWPHGDWSSEVWQEYDMFTLWGMTNNLYPKYSKFEKLVKIGSRRYNTTIVDGPSKSQTDNKPAVIVQIPRTVYCEMDMGRDIMRKLRDAPTFSDKHYDCKEAIEYC